MEWAGAGVEELGADKGGGLALNAFRMLQLGGKAERSRERYAEADAD